MIIPESHNFSLQKVACDILHFQSKPYLVLIDYFSKWIELVRLNSKYYSTIIKTLKVIFSIHEIPTTLIAENMQWNFSNLVRIGILK